MQHTKPAACYLGLPRREKAYNAEAVLWGGEAEYERLFSSADRYSTDAFSQPSLVGE
jgi:hypothetical protein